MLDTAQIENLSDPALAPYLTLRRPEDHRRKGIFVAEGLRVVQRLIESHFTIESVLSTPNWLPSIEGPLRLRPEPIRLFVTEKSVLENLTGFKFYQGLLAVGRIPQMSTLDELLLRTSTPRFFVAVDGLASAENLGGLVRNAAAFGVQGLLVGETSISPFMRRAVRSSMGGIFRLPIVESDHLASSLQVLRRAGMRCFAAHPHAQQTTLAQADFTQDCCLVFGNEGAGVSGPVLEACDDWVAIPMVPPVDSLNVSNASAVFFYEVNRQHGKM